MNVNACKCHYCMEGRQRSLLIVCIPFCKVSKRAFCRKSPILMGRNGLLKRGKLPSQIGYSGNITRRLSIFLLGCEGRRILSNAGPFY